MTEMPIGAPTEVGLDPLAAVPAPPRRGFWARLASSVGLLLALGYALGPRGLDVLTAGALRTAQPAVPVALVVLGVSTALGATERGAASRRASRWELVALVTLGLLMALVAHDSPAHALAAVGQAGAMALLVAAAGWVLASEGATDDERRIFSLATFLLVGGVAEYLGVSGLLLGWVAGAGCRRWKPTRLAVVRFDVAYIRPAVSAVLLVMAGARIGLTLPVVAIAAAVVAVVVLVLGPWADRMPSVRVAFQRLPVPPALLAVALAMDAVRTAPGLTLLFGVVVLAAAALDGLLGEGRSQEDLA